VQLVLINISDHHTRLKANSPDGAPLTLVMGCLLGSQDGRAVDVANSFEIKFTEAVDGSFEIDTPFLLKKAEQCECFYLVGGWVGGWGGGGGGGGAHCRRKLGGRKHTCALLNEEQTRAQQVEGYAAGMACDGAVLIMRYSTGLVRSGAAIS
jgi:hypothetical protein